MAFLGFLAVIELAICLVVPFAVFFLALRAELFEDPPGIANGMLTLKEQPGLGLTLSKRLLKKFGERIL